MTKNVLVVSHDKVGKKMAGPGMRYHQIATELSKHFAVTLATFNPEHSGTVDGAPYHLINIKTYDFKGDFDKFDTIIAMSLSDEMIDYAKSKNIRLIFDLYAPVPVEDLIAKVFAGKTEPEEAFNYAAMLSHYSNILNKGDFFLASNPIQKDFWLGFAVAGGATSPVSYGDFPLYDRIAELPMGINLDELNQKHDTNILSQRLPAIKETDFVLLWTGGIWDWFDAVTPIEAVASLVKKGHKSIKLVFLATRHPNTDVPEMDETAKAYKRADELGVLNGNVFFLEGWLDYNERLSYFLRGNAAIYAHKPSMETRYSHRTRVLDHFLTKMPSIVTGGDYVGDIIEANEYGICVEPEDAGAFEEAVFRLFSDPKLQKKITDNIAKDQSKYTWESSTKPLVEYLKSDIPARQIHALPVPTIPLAKRSFGRIIKKLLSRRVKERLKRIFFS